MLQLSVELLDVVSRLLDVEGFPGRLELMLVSEEPGGLVVIGLGSRQSLLQVLNADEKPVHELKNI